MTFEEWWEKDFLESGIYSEKYWLGERDAAKRAWNAALEEAAKIAESRASTPGSVLEAPIRSLKEE